MDSQTSGQLLSDKHTSEYIALRSSSLPLTGNSLDHTLNVAERKIRLSAILLSAGFERAERWPDEQQPTPPKRTALNLTLTLRNNKQNTKDDCSLLCCSSGLNK